jgi:spore germination protein KC
MWRLHDHPSWKLTKCFGRLRLFRGMMVWILLVALLTGCWDQREIEERTSVLALAVDQDPAGYKVSVQVPNPLKIFGAGGGGGGGGEEAVQMLTGKGKTLMEAMNDIQNQTNQEVFLGHARLVLIGEKVAKKGILPFMDGFRRHPLIRRRLWPLVVKGEARSVLQVKTKLEQVPTVYIMDMVDSGVRDGSMADMTMGRIFKALFNPALNPYLNYIKAEKDTVRWLGLALFKKDKMVGMLNTQESAILLQAKESKTGDPISVPCPDGKGEIVFQPTRVKTKYQINKTKGNVRIHVRILVNGEISEKTCPIDLSQDGHIEKVENTVGQWYERMGNSVLRKTQKEWKTDLFGFGNEIRAFHPDIWKSLNWNKQYPNAQIDLKYQVEIRRFGLDAK